MSEMTVDKLLAQLEEDGFVYLPERCDPEFVAAVHRELVYCKEHARAKEKEDYGMLNEQEIDGHEANVVICDENNRVDQLLKYHSDVDQEAVL